ncbi:hypothetical protein [Paenibacillus tianmuensis]|uniref:hypothetical protein n=1 Tax=Paenibacillus tianmuensis TaxID=624147 RepID=UPI000B8501E0|nr:hypothetical protein [Paenibacillus tianmuensis]
MSRLKVFFVILLSIIVLISLVYFIKSDPNSSEENEVNQVIHEFYSAYMSDPSLNQAAKHIKIDKYANQLLLYRFYYGEIQGFKTINVRKVVNNRFQIKMKVDTIRNKKKVAYQDTIILERENDSWVMEKYESTSDRDWPKLP